MEVSIRRRKAVTAMRHMAAVVLTLIVLMAPASAGPGKTDTLKFPVQRVTPLLDTKVYVVPEEEQRRQFPDFSARLYGVALLPSNDPYRDAWSSVLGKVMRPPLTAEVWGPPGRFVARLTGLVNGQPSDLNGQMIREGVAQPLKEGDQVPYRAAAEEAARRGIGRYAYRQVAWFWANSTALYALTISPAPGVRFPLAIAMVNPSRIEAGYLYEGRIVLLPTEKFRLGPAVVEVISDGGELTIVTRSLGLSTVTMRWRWEGDRYRFLRGSER